MRKLNKGVHLMISPELLKAIKTEAKRRKENMSVIMREALQQAFLKKKEVLLDPEEVKAFLLKQQLAE